MEYEATVRHIKYLEERYGVEIKRLESEGIEKVCKKVGVPFLSKHVSMMIGRLQRKGFKWEDESYEVLRERYKGCESALKWWCDIWYGRFGISYRKGLKEFLMKCPPTFKISEKCCEYVKIKPKEKYERGVKCDVSVCGVRKSEGGARSTAYKDEGGMRRPLFFWKDEDKKRYCEDRGIVHSDCYTVYGMRRTGCGGCPLNRELWRDLEVLKVYEGELYERCMRVFGEVYEYRRMYEEFKRNYFSSV